jgi:hypothetical protein
MSSGKKPGTWSTWRVSFHGLKVLAVIALASLIVGFFRAPGHDSHNASAPERPAGMIAPAKPVDTHSSFFEVGRKLYGSRPLYPYSIIPGGVESADELRKAVANDPVVAAHYAGFDLDHVHVVRLAEARSAFVSYRKHNTVFWTSKKLNLPAGETLITDGLHTSRTRCGNQVSDVPRTPTAPAGEPTPETLTTPLLTENIDPPPIDLPLGSPPTTGFLPPAGDGGEPGGIPPYVPIIVGGGSGGGGTSLIPVSQPPVPIATPEPGILLLTATGLCAAWLTRKLRKS